MPFQHASTRIALFACIVGVAVPAGGQVAPPSGHYAGRASDTGYAGVLNVMGGYGASVPLELPPARGGIPVPLSLTYTTRGMGVGGVGWDVPLSYVRADKTVARRRPADSPGSPLAGRLAMSLSLGGQTVALVPKGSGWVAELGPLGLSLQASSTGFTLTDGHGLTYRFVLSDALAGTGLWLLDSVTEPGGNTLKLTYAAAVVALATGGSAVTIELTGLSYNASGATCFKNEVALNYDPAVATPFGLSVLGTTVMAHTRILRTIDVKSRASCGGAAIRLRQYAVDYADDADTGLPRLSSVHVFGREDTPEKTLSLPIARYGYGSAVGGAPGAPTLGFVGPTTVSLPAAANPDYASSTIYNGAIVVPGWPTRGYVTWQSLTDLNGDGRPDLVYAHQNQLWVAYNRPGAHGEVTFLDGVPLNDATMTGSAFELRASSNGREETQTWRMAIDVNGDGRVDIVDASEGPSTWTVYLNTPGALSPLLPSWRRKTIDVTGLEALLVSHGYGGFPGHYIPLASKRTGHDVTTVRCVKWNTVTHVWDDDSSLYNSPQCPASGQVTTTDPSEKTFAEFQLQDINGDGYPDFVFDVGPVGTVHVPPIDGHGTADVELVGFSDRFEPTQGGEVDAVLNVVGVRLDTATVAFSAPLVLALERPPAFVNCGVAEWLRLGGSPWLQDTVCDLADVNGDGIVDRIENSTAYLGFGDGFSDVTLQLPGNYAEQYNPWQSECAGQAGSHTYLAHHTVGMRDLTGDGIPDFIRDRGIEGWTVEIGTGAGFRDPIAVAQPFIFSAETERCDGQISSTSSGIYDIDGDGRPDVLAIAGGKLNIYQLSGSSGAPRALDAGLLVSIDNGHGAVTHVGYASAKDDARTLHMVPFPENIVGSVSVTATLGHGGTTAPVSYAYGYASLYFDAMLDRFVMPAYGRVVELQLVSQPNNPAPQSHATITDTSGIAAFDGSVAPVRRYARYQEAGHPRDIWMVVGALDADPGALLMASQLTDTRIAGATHLDVGTRLFVEPAITSMPKDDCIEIEDPYDFKASKLADQGTNVFDTCSSHGFVRTTNVDGWRGTAPPPSDANVEARTFMTSTDDYGRLTSAHVYNDVHRSDDDYCVDTIYASSTGTTVFLDAPANRKTWDCDVTSGTFGATFAQEAWEYDGLPPGSVLAGRITGHTVDRRSTGNGAWLDTIRDADITYDGNGNPVTVTRKREDGAVRTLAFEYDPFALVPTHMTLSATGAATLNTYFTLDPYSQELLGTKDPNGTIRGATFDGFGRPTVETIRFPGNEITSALAKFTYLDFDEDNARGPSITVTQFTNPVLVTNLAQATGRATTTTFDELLRQRMTTIFLGSDYANSSLIVGARTYDSVGRVLFEADPYPSDQDGSTAYGTTSYFSSDGSPSCAIRASGMTPFVTVSNAATETFPTCFTHSFAQNQETAAMQDAASLTKATPPSGVISAQVTSALGWPLYRSTWQGGVRIEHEALSEDRFGQTVGITRYGDPIHAGQPVSTSWTLDTFGRVTSMSEPGDVVQLRDYSRFGDLKSVSWAPSGEPPHAIARRYDGLGRILHSEEQDGGVTNLATVNDFLYDVGVVLSPTVVPRYVVGRLAKASAPTGAIGFSYDLYGGVADRVYTDTGAGVYIQADTHNGDGSIATNNLILPDTSGVQERTGYGYDSAGRIRLLNYSNGPGGETIYKATTIDALGRIRNATFGANTYVANYADTGRRLMKDVTVGKTGDARKIIYSGFDAVGRELGRTEIQGTGTHGVTTVNTYDPLGRVATSVQSNSLLKLSDRSFSYDALGNIQSLVESVHPSGAWLGYASGPDPDRACNVSYTPPSGPQSASPCNIGYDGAGNMTSEPTRTGSRTFDFYDSGAVRTIVDGAGATAHFRYDALGDVQELDVDGGTSPDQRHDRRYGLHIERHDQVTGSSMAQVFSRRFFAPGVTAIRRGPTGPWLFQFADGRGTRFSTDTTGAFQQDLSYTPFGEASSSGAAARTAMYSNEQWNGGDALAAFGLVHVGARVVDPVLGRFVSRDPLLSLRTAATTNPYSFADNDPVNGSDPTGLEPFSTEDPLPLQPLVPFGGRGAAGHVPTAGTEQQSTPTPLAISGSAGIQGLIGNTEDKGEVVLRRVFPRSVVWAATDVAVHGILGVACDFMACDQETGGNYDQFEPDGHGGSRRVLRVPHRVSNFDLARNVGLNVLGGKVVNSVVARVLHGPSSMKLAMTIHGTDKDLTKFGKRVPNFSDGYFNVVGHSDGDVVEVLTDFGLETGIGPGDLATIIESNPLYNGESIRLIMCNAGNVDASLGRAVAKILGVPVLAGVGEVTLYRTAKWFGIFMLYRP